MNKMDLSSFKKVSQLIQKYHQLNSAITSEIEHIKLLDKEAEVLSYDDNVLSKLKDRIQELLKDEILSRNFDKDVYEDSNEQSITHMLNDVIKNKIIEETIQFKNMNLMEQHDIYSDETVLKSLIRKDLAVQIHNLDILIQLKRELIEEEKTRIEKIEKMKMEYLKRIEIVQKGSRGMVIEIGNQEKPFDEDLNEILDFLLNNLNLSDQNVQDIMNLKYIIIDLLENAVTSNEWMELKNTGWDYQLIKILEDSGIVDVDNNHADNVKMSTSSNSITSKYNWSKALSKISQFSEHEKLEKICVVNILAKEESISSVILAHIGCDSFLLEDLLDIVIKIQNNNLEKELIYLNDQSYIITSVHENSYYGRLTNPSSGGIIINLIKQRNAAIISLYDSRFSPFLLIPYIETAVDDIRRASGQ